MDDSFQNTAATVLIVDDQQVNLKIMASLLKPTGCRLLTAEDGRQALAIVENDPPDLILLDIMMPEIDGFEVCRRLKQSAQWRVIPIIMVTALDQTEDYVRGLESGADDFMTKPINPNVLLARIKSYIHLKRLSDENARLDSLKRDLTRMIIHDLSNPITGIMGQLQLLTSDESLPDKLKQQLSDLTNAARYVVKLILNMRSIDKLESGTLALRAENLHPGQLARQTIDILRPFWEDKQLTILTQGTEELVCFWDRDLMTRVMQNLLDNAISFSPKASTIQFSWGWEGGTAWMSIANHGPTIPADEQARVFDKFTQLELPALRTHRGSGLGLAFCRLAVEAHQGVIHFSSPAPGWEDGALFRFELPVKPVT